MEKQSRQIIELQQKRSELEVKIENISKTGLDNHEKIQKQLQNQAQAASEQLNLINTRSFVASSEQFSQHYSRQSSPSERVKTERLKSSTNKFNMELRKREREDIQGQRKQAKDSINDHLSEINQLNRNIR